MITRFLVPVLPLVVACASSGSTSGTAASRATASAGPIEGNYEYLANLPSHQVRGAMRVLGDTILVDPVSDYCRPVVSAPDPFYIRYTCQGTGTYEQITLTIDRRNPAQLSKWSATFRVTRQRLVCVEYAMRDGRQVCVRSQNETYETTETKTGNLQVRRATP